MIISLQLRHPSLYQLEGEELGLTQTNSRRSWNSLVGMG